MSTEPLPDYEHEVVEKLRKLPAEKQRRVLALVEELSQPDQSSEPPRAPKQSCYGLWAGLGVKITEEDLDDVRREMWANFPRELPTD